MEKNRKSLVCFVLALTTILSGCGGCLFAYCAYDGSNPPADIFTVYASGPLLVGHRDNSGSTFATEARYPPGTHTVWVAIDGDDEDDDSLSDFQAFLIAGAPGDMFDASCFQYNGNTVLWLFTEVLTGYEITNRHTGALIARIPSRPVVRRNDYC